MRAPAAPTGVARTGTSEHPVVGLRRKIAEKMVESKLEFRISHTLRKLMSRSESASSTSECNERSGSTQVDLPTIHHAGLDKGNAQPP